MCTGYVSYDSSDDSYSIIIPHVVAGQNITTLGSNLFNVLENLEYDEEGDLIGLNFNKYNRIKSIEIEEGITTIGDIVSDDTEIDLESLDGTFVGLGINYDEEVEQNILFEDGVSFKFPNSLNYIGPLSFIGVDSKILDLSNTSLVSLGPNAIITGSYNKIVFPSTLESIGDYALQGNYELETIEFIGAEDGTSHLKKIGDYFLWNSSLSYSFEEPLKIPRSVEYIGIHSFAVTGLEGIEFMGAEDGTSKLKYIGDEAFIYSRLISTVEKPLKIPKSVEWIGDDVFHDREGLTRVEFVGADNGTSNLYHIGKHAFLNCNLMYTTFEDSLLIPQSVTFMGNGAFEGNVSLNYIKYFGTTNLGNNWYNNYRVANYYAPNVVN